MSERWFSPDELDQMSRPTMDRAIEALDRGDAAEARRLCEQMRSEWRHLHDLMAEQLLGLVTFIQQRFGEEKIAEAWELDAKQRERR
ncbi:hypothetical protein ACQP1G_16875 [Nocardia sp. CA-107356]|uniref:hypothetical protein n=1 Tax=Nocardia sp. CA-107356 TaxID=3239972 RepID=UPI003D91AC6F